MLIQQVLMNLLENAVLHGKGMKELTLQVQTQKNDAVFTVTDNGCGIPKERLFHLFDGYIPNDDLPADSRRTGMGIGLSVCASIIKAVWGYPDAGSVKKLQVNMANIRRKLGIQPGQSRYVINELGVGYRMEDENE